MFCAVFRNENFNSIKFATMHRSLEKLRLKIQICLVLRTFHFWLIFHCFDFIG